MILESKRPAWHNAILISLAFSDGYKSIGKRQLVVRLHLKRDCYSKSQQTAIWFGIKYKKQTDLVFIVTQDKAKKASLKHWILFILH